MKTLMYIIVLIASLLYIYNHFSPVPHPSPAEVKQMAQDIIDWCNE